MHEAIDYARAVAELNHIFAHPAGAWHDFTPEKQRFSALIRIEPNSTRANGPKAAHPTSKPSNSITAATTIKAISPRIHASFKYDIQTWGLNRKLSQFYALY